MRHYAHQVLNQPVHQPPSHLLPHRKIQRPNQVPTQASIEPTTAPSPTPSTKPSARPSATPSTTPSAEPTTTPSSTPSTEPSVEPSLSPSSNPSSQPTTPPSPKPSSFPSFQPSRLTCEVVNPCDYEMKHDGNGGVQVTETYYPACIRQITKKKSIYHQECYSEDIIYGLGAGDVDTEHDDRTIVNCGCCPSGDMLPAAITEVKGCTDVCDGGLDCFAEGTSVSSSKKKINFQMCIDGDDEHWEENFYIPKDHETAACGQCDSNGDIIV